MLSIGKGLSAPPAFDRQGITVDDLIDFLTAASMAASNQSQAMMQRLLAAMLRQEADRIAHQNSLRKRAGILAAKVRQGISEVLRRP